MISVRDLKVVYAQGTTWDPHDLSEGKYAIVMRSNDEAWPEGTVVKIEGVIGDEALVRKYARSVARAYLPLRWLKKVWVVNPTDKEEYMEIGSMPLLPVKPVKELSEFDPKLYAYLGKRTNQIIQKAFSPEDYEKYKKEFVRDVGDGKYLPVLDPLIVIALFLKKDGKTKATQGFVHKQGETKGYIFVNKNSVFTEDEVIAHEFFHILSFYSHHTAVNFENESLRFGIEEFEMDMDVWMGMKEEEMRKIRDIKNREEAHEADRGSYFRTPAEVFAHTEQIKWFVEKMIEDDLEEVERLFELKKIDKKERDRRIDIINNRPYDYYKEAVINKLKLSTPKQHDIFSDPDREFYEKLFEYSKTA